MFTTQEFQLILNDLNEGARREGLQNAGHRLNIAGKLQAMAQQQAQANGADKVEQPAPEPSGSKRARARGASQPKAA